MLIVSYLAKTLLIVRLTRRSQVFGIAATRSNLARLMISTGTVSVSALAWGDKITGTRATGSA